MSKIDEALNMCIELGKILCETEEYKRMKQSEYALLHDNEARSLVEELQTRQAEFQRKNMVGVPINEAERQSMRDLEEKALANPTVKNSHEANTQFQELMKKISAKIREGIRLNTPENPR